MFQVKRHVLLLFVIRSDIADVHTIRERSHSDLDCAVVIDVQDVVGSLPGRLAILVCRRHVVDNRVSYLILMHETLVIFALIVFVDDMLLTLSYQVPIRHELRVQDGISSDDKLRRTCL